MCIVLINRIKLYWELTGQTGHPPGLVHFADFCSLVIGSATFS